MYSIFQVYDYKGGELSSMLNMSLEKISKEIIRMFNLNDNINASMNKKQILDELSKTEICYDDYAGYQEGFCGSIYRHVNNSLEEIYPDDLFDSVADYLIEDIKKRPEYYK